MGAILVVMRPEGQRVLPIIAARIRERREHLGWTQAELATATGTTRATVGNYEAGRREPDLETLLRLARALGTSVSYLVGETDDPAPPRKADSPAPLPQLEDIARALQEMGYGGPPVRVVMGLLSLLRPGPSPATEHPYGPGADGLHLNGTGTPPDRRDEGYWLGGRPMATNAWARQVVRAVAEEKSDRKDKIIQAGWAMCDAIEAQDDFWQRLRDVVAVGEENGVTWNDAVDILIALIQAKLKD